MSEAVHPAPPAIWPWQAVVRTKPVAEFNELERFVYLFEPAAPENSRLFRERLAELLSATANLSQASRDVLAERERQICQEGWSPEDDDAYEDDELADAAVCYIQGFDTWVYGESLQRWPWALQWWKPTTQRRNLVKAGALILAEIDRLDRADARTSATGGL